MTIRRTAAAIACALAIGFASTAAPGASHLWRFNEVFSSADGSIMFIEMMESKGAAGETALADKWVESIATGNQYVFSENLIPPTSDRHLLLATQAFAELPGAPAPDFIIPENFFEAAGDTLEYWFYSAATWTFPQPVPTDGVNSLHMFKGIATNSPTNYAGESGSIVVPGPCEADTNGDDDVNVVDLTNVILDWGTNGAANGGDVNGDHMVDVTDLTDVILNWGAC